MKLYETYSAGETHIEFRNPTHVRRDRVTGSQADRAIQAANRRHMARRGEYVPPIEECVSRKDLVAEYNDKYGTKPTPKPEPIRENPFEEEWMEMF